MDHTVLPANYTMPAFTPQPQSITALWLVLILPSHVGRRLSRPGWLVTYRNKVPPPGVEPGHGHPSQSEVETAWADGQMQGVDSSRLLTAGN